MLRRLLFLTTYLAWTSSTLLAQGPNNSSTYYMSANGQKFKALKTALSNIIVRDKDDVLSYDGLIGGYRKTDTRSDGFVRDWYSNATNYQHDTDKAGSYTKEGDCYNREHSIPQSWFSEAAPMKSDIIHVFPTDGFVNNKRSSYPFGEVGTIEYQSSNGYSKLGACKISGYSGKVFEPNDEVKGDIARIYFYMATCYENRIANWGGTLTNDSYKPFPQWQMDMLMRWSQSDPIDNVEKARNEAVFEVQGNRNPFVDYPGLEQLIWGNSTDVAFIYDNYAPPIGTGGNQGEGEGGGSSTDLQPSEEEGVYAKITSTSDLTSGMPYLIVCESQDVAMAEQDSKSRNKAAISITAQRITTAVGESGKPYELVLGGNASAGYSLYDPVNKTYLALTSNSNEINQLSETTTNNALWTISFNQGNAIIKNKAYTSRSIQYNTSAKIFRTYTSGQTVVQIYKKQQTTGIGKTYITVQKERVAVHSIQGTFVRLTDNYPDALRDLPKGIYIINGRKIAIR